MSSSLNLPALRLAALLFCWWVSAVIPEASLAAPLPGKTVLADPNTQEGFLLQLIGAENDVNLKRTLLEKFVVQFPKFESLDLVYADLQAVYMTAGDFPKAIAAGEKALAIDPRDIECAQRALRAAEASKDAALVKAWTQRIQQIAKALLSTPQSKSHDDSDVLQARLEIARQWIGSEEYALYKKAFDAADPRQKIEYLEALRKRYPDSSYLKHAPLLYFIAYRQLGDTRRAFQTGEKILETDQTHEDVLLLVADTLFRSKTDAKRVLAYSNRILELMNSKPKPAGLTDAEWMRQRNQLSGLAHSMIGGIYLAQEQYGPADRSLRQALPLLAGPGRQPQIAATLSFLGWANYKMKNYSEANRFYTQCLAIDSPYRENALKNIEVIKAEQAEQR